jgi:NTP pyrophosphatase (non-canonical NTP hydrolase)
MESFGDLTRRVATLGRNPTSSGELHEELKNRCLKLVEEVGELLANALAMTGSRNKSKSASASDAELREESIDVLINALDVFYLMGGTDEELLRVARRKCDKWESKFEA